MKIQTKDPLLDHKFIVLCGDHYNPLGLLRSLGEAGIEPIVILADRAPFLVPCSKYIGKLHRVEDNTHGFSLLLEKYGNEAVKPFLYACSDDIESLLDEHYETLKEKFYFFDGGSAGRITGLMNKDEINKLAAQCGARIPRSEVVARGTLPTEVPYPVITKSIASTVGGWKNDVYVCRNEAELREAYAKIETPVVLVEEFIEKKNELCVDGASIHNGEYVYMPLKCHYIRFTEKAYGNYMTMSPFEEGETKRLITEIIRATRFTGIFSIEFLVTKEDELVFLEVNFRNSTWSYSATHAGANLPIIWARSVLKGSLDLTDVAVSPEPFTAMAEQADFNDHVRHGDLSFRQWLKEFRACPCTYVYDPKNRKPFFALVWHSLKLLLKKKLCK